jgi:large subunit ribosomal protein L23
MSNNEILNNGNPTLCKVILGKVMTDKAINLEKDSVFTFQVALWSNKEQIKNAAISLLGIEDVLHVKTFIRKGKTKNYKKREYNRKDKKFALIKIKGDLKLGGIA